MRGEHSPAFHRVLSTHPHPTPNRPLSLLQQGFHRHRAPTLANEHVPHRDAELGSGVQRSASWRKAAGGWGSEGLGVGVSGGAGGSGLPSKARWSCLSSLQFVVCKMGLSAFCPLHGGPIKENHKGRCEWRWGWGGRAGGSGKRLQQMA